MFIFNIPGIPSSRDGHQIHVALLYLLTFVIYTLYFQQDNSKFFFLLQTEYIIIDNNGLYKHFKKNNFNNAAVAQWLERSPREREVVGSIPDRVIPKTL